MIHRSEVGQGGDFIGLDGDASLVSFAEEIARVQDGRELCEVREEAIADTNMRCRGVSSINEMPSAIRHDLLPRWPRQEQLVLSRPEYVAYNLQGIVLVVAR